MKKAFFSALILCCSCTENPVSTNSLIKCLTYDNSVQHTKIDGQFKYYYSDHESDHYKAVSVSDSKYKLYYNINPLAKDSLLVNEVGLIIPSKLDPLTIEVYEMFFKGSKFWLLMQR